MDPPGSASVVLVSVYGIPAVTSPWRSWSCASLIDERWRASSNDVPCAAARARATTTGSGDFSSTKIGVVVWAPSGLPVRRVPRAAAAIAAARRPRSLPAPGVRESRRRVSMAVLLQDRARGSGKRKGPCERSPGGPPDAALLVRRRSRGFDRVISWFRGGRIPEKPDDHLRGPSPG